MIINLNKTRIGLRYNNMASIDAKHSRLPLIFARSTDRFLEINTRHELGTGSGISTRNAPTDASFSEFLRAASASSVMGFIIYLNVIMRERFPRDSTNGAK